MTDAQQRFDTTSSINATRSLDGRGASVSEVDGRQLRCDLCAHLDRWVLVLHALHARKVPIRLESNIGCKVREAGGGDAPERATGGLGGLDGGQRRVGDHHLVEAGQHLQ